MRYAILGDIHGNLEALESVLNVLMDESIDTYFCIGDSVGYGADPAKCLGLVQDMHMQAVCGNHDGAVCGRLDMTCFNASARVAVQWTAEHIDAHAHAYLQSLPLVHAAPEADMTITHGSLEAPERFGYIRDLDAARHSLVQQTTSLCFVGHTHIPLWATAREARRCEKHPCRFYYASDTPMVVNVGSVGQPRDGNPDACYATCDTERHLVEIKRVGYNKEQAAEKIRAAGLPAFLADRLFIGR